MMRSAQSLAEYGHGREAFNAIQASLVRVVEHLERGDRADAERAVADAVGAMLEASWQPLLGESRQDSGGEGLIEQIADDLAEDMARAVVPATLDEVARAAGLTLEPGDPQRPCTGALAERLRPILRRVPCLARTEAAIKQARFGGYAEQMMHLVEMGPRWAVPMQPDEVPVAHQAFGHLFVVLTAPRQDVPEPRFDADARERIAQALARALVKEVL